LHQIQKGVVGNQIAANHEDGQAHLRAKTWADILAMIAMTASHQQHPALRALLSKKGVCARHYGFPLLLRISFVSD
jgi:hypothetical protein